MPEGQLTDETLHLVPPPDEPEEPLYPKRTGREPHRQMQSNSRADHGGEQVRCARVPMKTPRPRRPPPKPWRHPVTPTRVTVPCELNTDYRKFLGPWMQQFDPQNFLEALPVGDLAQMHFRLNRYPRIEAGMIWTEYDERRCPPGRGR